METISGTYFSKHQNNLKNQGYCIATFNLPSHLKLLIEHEKFSEIDIIFKKLLSPGAELFHYLTLFTPFDISHIEHIISIRNSNNEWEEDGIWHDDGSRVLAFSLSLTSNDIKGGVLEIRKKSEQISIKIPTPSYGSIIIFKTGHDHFEHKINRVTKGKRIIIAGWLYQK